MKRINCTLRSLALALAALTSVGTLSAAEAADSASAQLPAFPGAEGFGRYTTGGRGGKVLHVTSLDDDVHEPAEGTLRWAINQKYPRTIVFDVCGTIRLKGDLSIRTGDLTIAGQTAPGDGICIAEWPFQIKASNVILRYLRIRPGSVHADKHEADGLGSMDQNDIIVDHCSISWSIDECCSVYGGRNLTVQWCIISQSLRNAGHSKGTHGYGGNWGGSGCTYAHNLLCHHGSRTPRLGPRPGTQLDERLDLRNNVIYNWAGNGCYGGEGMNVNIVNNYYKPGPATMKRPRTVRMRIAAPGIRTSKYCGVTEFDANGRPKGGNKWLPMWHVWGDYYVDGNVNPDFPELSYDNWNYGVWNQIDRAANDSATDTEIDTLKVDRPLPFPLTTSWSAEEAYERVLGYSGCVKVRPGSTSNSTYLALDYIDSVMVRDTREGKATFGSSEGYPGLVDTEEDTRCGANPEAWPLLRATHMEIARQKNDTDDDGIPDYWEKKLGLDARNADDALQPCTAEGYEGYSNFEYYLAYIVAEVTTHTSDARYALGNEVDGGSYVNAFQQQEHERRYQKAAEKAIKEKKKK